MDPVGFCTLCGFEFASFESITKCPRCGSTHPPCKYMFQEDVSINIHELRILSMWAESWALQQAESSEMCDVNLVYAIATRLRKQFSRDASLTVADEFRAMQAAGHTFITNHPAADDPTLGSTYLQ